MSMTTPRLCRFCGQMLPGDAPKGFCPTCLLKLFGSDVTHPTGKGHASGQSPAIEAMRRFGDYELLGEIAAGGMGVVYLARQIRLNRTVALKMIRSGSLATTAEIQRFKREAEAAAALDHPNIVPIHEVGEVAGQHFFSMKLMEGGNLAEALQEGELRFVPHAARDAKDSKRNERVARLVAIIARAVHHAHQRGVLHRDLKPTNILLDDAGEPHLTDFGLARLMDGPAVTQSLAVIGTPAYMAPEQAAGGTRQLTTAVDVYSLGAILYELLGGRPPFIGDSAIQILSQVKDREPDPLARVNPKVDRDLATAATKCLEKNPDLRYPSALAFAEDLERFLRREPIQARPASVSEKFTRWCRRQPALAAALGACALALLLGVAGVVDQWRRAEHHARSEAGERQRAEEAVFRLTFEKAEALFERDRAAHGLAQLARLLRQYPTNRTVAARIQSALSRRAFALPVAAIHHERNVTQVRFSPDERHVLTTSHDGTARLSDAQTGATLSILQHPKPVTYAEFSPTGDRVVTACRDGAARIWKVESGRLIGEPMRHEDFVEFATFSPDGLRIATASRDKTARVWNASTGEALILPIVHARALRSVSFSPDGKRLVTVAEGARVRRADVQTWNAETGAAIGSIITDALQYSAEFTPDGAELWIGNSSAHDPVSGKLLRTLPRIGEWSILSSEFSRDGQWVLTASQDNSARVWNWRTGQSFPARMDHDHFVTHASFSRDGRHIATASRDTTVRLWSADGRALSEPLRHAGHIYEAFANSNATRLLTRPGGNDAWLWEFRPRPKPPSFAHEAGLLWAAFTRDGKRLVTTSQDHTARLWDVATGRMLAEPFPHFGWINHVEWSPDERWFVTGAQDGIARIWDPASPTPVRYVRHRDHVRRARFSTDGKRLFTASYDSTAQIWDTRTGERIGQTMTHPQRVQSIDLSPDGQRLLVASQDGTVRVWNAVTGEPLTPPAMAGVLLLNARFTPDGKRFITVANDRTARVWDAATAQAIGSPVEHSDEISAFSPDFSADGRQVLTAAGNTARLWDLETRLPVSEAMTHNGVIRSAWFSPDKSVIATTSADRTVRLWDAATALPITEPLPHDGVVPNAFFTPDGRFLLTLGDDALGRLWEVPTLTEPVPEWLPDLAEAVGGMRFNERNLLEVAPPSLFVELRRKLTAAPPAVAWGTWLNWFLAGPDRPSSPNAGR